VQNRAASQHRVRFSGVMRPCFAHIEHFDL
jgi:hypothetical protein